MDAANIIISLWWKSQITRRLPLGHIELLSFFRLYLKQHLLANMDQNSSLYLTSCGAFLLIDSPTFVYFGEITGTTSPLAFARFAGTKSWMDSLVFEATGVTKEAILFILRFDGICFLLKLWNEQTKSYGYRTLILVVHVVLSMHWSKLALHYDQQ